LLMGRRSRLRNPHIEFSMLGSAWRNPVLQR
jgi:hypothetical protein